MSLLDENKAKFNINGLTKYYKISGPLAKRDYKRFMAIEERDRKEIFQDYVDELLQEDLDKQDQKRQK